MARPPKPPHPLEKQIEGMAAINCTWAEIEAVQSGASWKCSNQSGSYERKGIPWANVKGAELFPVAEEVE